MRTIDLTTKIVNIRTGNPVKQPKTDKNGKPIVKKEEYICEECGQKVGGEVEKEFVVIRDYLLTLLGSKFKIQDTKENFWTTKIGIKVADEENETIKLSEDKTKFLKRIIKKNKVTRVQNTPMGKKEKKVELFFPYEVGQLLAALDVPRDSELEEKKEAKELKEEMDKKSK